MAAFNSYSPAESPWAAAICGTAACVASTSQKTRRTRDILGIERASRLPVAVPAVSSLSEMSAAGSSCTSSSLPLAPMWPINQFYSKVPPVLGNRGLHVFEASGVGVALIENIVETRGNVEVFLELARIYRGIHDEEPAQIGLSDGPSPAGVLRVETGKELFLRQGNTEIALGQLFRRIGQNVIGHDALRVLQGMRNCPLQAARPLCSHLPFDALGLQGDGIRIHRETSEWIPRLFDQIVNAIQKPRAGHGIGFPETMLQVQLPGANPLRPQSRVRRVALVAGIEAFKAVRSAEGPAVGRPDVCSRGCTKNQPYTWTERVSILFMPIIA